MARSLHIPNFASGLSQMDIGTGLALHTHSLIHPFIHTHTHTTHAHRCTKQKKHLTFEYLICVGWYMRVGIVSSSYFFASSSSSSSFVCVCVCVLERLFREKQHYEQMKNYEHLILVLVFIFYDFIVREREKWSYYR